MLNRGLKNLEKKGNIEAAQAVFRGKILKKLRFTNLILFAQILNENKVDHSKNINLRIMLII
jgi:hypothetical protein